jgi:hypothetical protein
MKKESATNLFQGVWTGLVGFALAGFGFGIAAIFSKPVGVAVFWLGFSVAFVGFLLHLSIVIDRLFKRFDR